MIRRIIPLLVLIFFCFEVQGQYKHGPFKTKRKKVAAQNYTLFLHLNDIAIEYSTKIEYKVDSLFDANNTSFHKGLFDFRIRTLQSLEHVLFKSDPVIGFLDSWVYGAQMTGYLQTPEARDYLGFGHATFLALFEDFTREFPQTYDMLVEGDPAEMTSRVERFSQQYPILDHHLNRTSIIDGTAQWVGDANLGLVGGLSTLTDLLRNISDRLNYHAEFTPKMIEWNVESTVGNLLGTDSLGPILEESISSLAKITQTLDSIDHLVYSVTDTVLTDVDRQRRETLYFIRAERTAILEQVSLERQAIMEQVTREREAIEQLIREERQASFDHLETIVTNTTDYSFDRVDQMVNRIFFKVLILAALIVVGIVIGVILFKKL